jgi:diacylglycerol kinase (ATP)
MNHHPPSTAVGRVLTVVLGAVPFTVLTLLVFEHWGPLARWDQSVSARAASYGAAHEGIVDFWQVVGAIVLPWTWRALIAIVAAYLWNRRARLLAIWLVTSAVAELVLVQVVKAVFERPRPVPLLGEAGGFSYVSGHAAAAFVMAGALGVVLPSVRGWRRRFRLLVLLPVIAVVWIASADRIALNVH